MPIHDQTPIDVAIWRVSHHHRHVVHTRIESLGLYRGQHRLIDKLHYEDGLTHGELAKALNISNATISKMVQRMEQTGFVDRRPDKSDQRISRVYLTEKGRDIHEQMNNMFIQLQEDEIEGFTEEEVAQFVSYLDRLNQNLMKHIPHHHKQTTKKKEEEEE
jgi:DNA-binding MarR family transcriptional regulator